MIDVAIRILHPGPNSYSRWDHGPFQVQDDEQFSSNIEDLINECASKHPITFKLINNQDSEQRFQGTVQFFAHESYIELLDDLNRNIPQDFVTILLDWHADFYNSLGTDSTAQMIGINEEEPSATYAQAVVHIRQENS